MSPTIEYGHVEPIRVHFDELDAMGMVHHARYVLLLDRAIIAYWMRQGWSVDPEQSVFPDTAIVVREVSVTMHAPARGVGDLAVHFWLEKLGSTSTLYGFRVRSADHRVLHAEGTRVSVNIDPRTFRPTPFSEALRAASQPLLRPADATTH